MKREKEIPVELLKWLETQNQRRTIKEFNNLEMFYTTPVRAVKMKILGDDWEDEFHTVIIPAIDIYITERAFLKKGFFKRDALYFFVAGTHTPFPYGHIYANSGAICLGSIFVPSAVPERSPAMPIETLFLHNDRNLSHGNSHLHIEQEKVAAIENIITDTNVKLSNLSKSVLTKSDIDIIANDGIWNLSADVAKQKRLPEAINIMKNIYNIIFETDEEKASSENEN